MKRPFKRSKLWEAVAGLVGVALVIVWLSGGFSPRVAPGSAELVGATVSADAPRATIEVIETPEIEWTSGTVTSARETTVAARILARIAAIRVRAGDVVRRGDVLVVFEAKDIKARVAQARDALKTAKARLALAGAEKERFTPLYESGVIPRQRYDEVIAKYDAARAEVGRLEEALKEAEAELSYTVMRAPVSGRVVERLAEPGETAVVGRPLLRLYDPSVLRVETPVRESLAVHLDVGERLRARAPALGRSFEGPIEEIVPFAEPGARTLLVKVGLPQDPKLFAGMYMSVAIPAGTARRLAIPAAAITRIGQLDFADVVNAAGRRERRLVTLGAALDDDRIEVLSGLDAGETVLLAEQAPAALR